MYNLKIQFCFVPLKTSVQEDAVSVSMCFDKRKSGVLSSYVLHHYGDGWVCYSVAKTVLIQNMLLEIRIYCILVLVCTYFRFGHFSSR